MLNITQIIEKTTNEYINQHQPLPDETVCAYEVVEEINNAINLENTTQPENNKFSLIKDIPDMAVAMLIAAREDVALIAPGDKSQTNRKLNMTAEQRFQLPVGIYQYSGGNEGVWEVSNDPLGAFGMLVEKYKPGAARKTKQEIFLLAKARLRVVRKCVIPYYTAANNCIVDVLNKKILPFDPEIVFTSKLHTDFNPNATNPAIPIPEDGTVWDVVSWLDEFGSPSLVKSIKEVIQSVCLPLTPRNQACLLHSTQGCNGKGTLCQLMRNLLGEQVVVNIALEDFSTRFALADLPNAVAVITDENSVNSFGKGMKNLKAAITGDKLKIEQKYEKMYDFSFRGAMIFCVNNLPNCDDKSGSMKRRLHFLNFPNSFTGAEKRYIKERLIYREDVLEYILKLVLFDMPYREQYTKTEESEKMLKAYTIQTNSVVAFLEEILPICKYDLLAASDFLYEGFKTFYKRISPAGKIPGRNDFIQSVKEYVATDPVASLEWEWTDSTRSKGYIDCTIEEPLINEYDILPFANTMYSPGCEYRAYACEDKLKEKYSGLKRRSATVNTQTANNTTTSEVTDND